MRSFFVASNGRLVLACDGRERSFLTAPMTAGRDQLQPGGVLVAGAVNSGAEIARELASRHRIWMSGRDVGQIPFDIGGLAARLFLARFMLRVVFRRVLTTDTPLGRKARAKMLHAGGPLIRRGPFDHHVRLRR